jgi:hypothetical protein
MSSGFCGAVEGHEGFEDGDHLVLLAARELRGFLEELAHFAAWGDRFAGAREAEDFLDGDAEGFGDRQQKLHFADFAGAFPIEDVGMAGADLAGEFAHGQAGLFAQAGEVGV